MRCRNISLAPLSVLALATVLVIGPTLFTAPASAAGFEFRWNQCAADGGVSNLNFACNDDVSTHTVVASFTLGQAVPQVIQVQAVVDFIVADGQPVPPWWDFAGCHASALDADADIDPAAVNCADWSGATGVAVVTSFNQDGNIALGNAASHRRIEVTGAVPAPVNLPANQAFFLFNLDFDSINTTGPSGCAGCNVPVCIVLNSIRFLSTATGVTTLANASTAGSNFATWQGGAGANCQAVPVRRSTWARVKEQFR